jgi:uncharacterized protein (DUF934 family)
MQKLLDKDGQIVENDPWQILPKDFSGEISGQHKLLPLTYWQETQSDMSSHEGLGIWFDSDEEPELVAEHLATWSCIGIHFPTFMDGRGFSLARLIREHYDYKGELRAFGHIIPDQLFFLVRCGFDTFSFGESQQIADPQNYFDSFSVNYQNCVDQPQPLFRRR